VLFQNNVYESEIYNNTITTTGNFGHGIILNENVYQNIVKNNFITTVYLDFLIESKIVLELKQGDRFYKKDIEQVYNYLTATNLQLGILARFTKSGVKIYAENFPAFKEMINSITDEDLTEGSTESPEEKSEDSPEQETLNPKVEKPGEEKESLPDY
ncbi:MAG: GxxExxY protein, partial [Bacteroidetes bacterium]|nr:GxxExxY protein [Bacteroidota bacterium]